MTPRLQRRSSGTQRAQLGILNTYQEQNRAVANEIASLDIAVDKAEAKLKAAQGQLAAAAPGSVDAARAAGLVERAQIGLTGAQDRRAQFGESPVTSEVTTCPWLCPVHPRLQRQGRGGKDRGECFADA